MQQKFLLLSDELSDKIFTELAEIKKLLTANTKPINNGEDEIMDTARLMQYLHMDRRTIYNYRTHKGMPFHRAANGRIYFWKAEIDAFFGKSKTLL
jgi:predicted DNA-binding transcriptional regulator AlpA